MIYAYPPFTVRADTPVSECVELMNKNHIGSVLVISDDENGDLVGIFTERDLLKKFSLIQSGQHWNSPIRTVMTHPVQTLNIEDLDKAADVMFISSFRHLPIVSTEEGKSSPRVIGILSMRDIFRRQYIASLEKVTKSTKIDARTTKSICISSKDKDLSRILVQLNRSLSVSLLEDALKYTTLKNSKPPKFDFLIFDIDGLTAAEWSKAIKKLIRELSPRNFLIIFTPKYHGANIPSVLNRLSKSDQFRVFPKPLNFLAVSEFITDH